MFKIVKIEGNQVFIGAADGRVMKVDISNLRFTPAIGDEVEIYQTNGTVVVAKKGATTQSSYVQQPNGFAQPVNNYPQQNNFPQPANNYPQPSNFPQPANPQSADTQEKSSPGLLIGLYAAMIVSIVACFLPLLSITVLGRTYSINYAFNDGEPADGIFIIVIQLVALFMLLRKKTKSVCSLELVSLFIFGATFFNVFDKSKQLLSLVDISIFDILGIGFYVLTISLITSSILSVINALKNRD